MGDFWQHFGLALLKPRFRNPFLHPVLCLGSWTRKLGLLLASAGVSLPLAGLSWEISSVSCFLEQSGCYTGLLHLYFSPLAGASQTPSYWLDLKETLGMLPIKLALSYPPPPLICNSLFTFTLLTSRLISFILCFHCDISRILCREKLSTIRTYVDVVISFLSKSV